MKFIDYHIVMVGIRWYGMWWEGAGCLS